MSQRQQPQPQPTKQQQQQLHVQGRAASATAAGGCASGEANVFAFDFDGEAVGFGKNSRGSLCRRCLRQTKMFHSTIERRYGILLSVRQTEMCVQVDWAQRVEIQRDAGEQQNSVHRVKNCAKHVSRA